jgi:hypothetical protein
VRFGVGYVVCECVKVGLEKRKGPDRVLGLYPLKLSVPIQLDSTYCGLYCGPQVLWYCGCVLFTVLLLEER